MGDRNRTAMIGRTASRTRRLFSFRWVRRSYWAPLAAAGMVASGLVPSPSSAQSAAPKEGIVCANPAGSTSFVLRATSGYIGLPDGNSVYMWGYAYGNGAFQYPGPVLCVSEGDNVSITLKDGLPVPTSLAFPGLTKVKVDGSVSQLDSTSDSLTKPAMPGASATYTFNASSPGTYLYESGTNPQLQALMGMVGALIVRPALNAGAPAGTAYVYNDASTAYNPNNEFMHLLSELDPHMHHAIELQVLGGQAPPFTYDMKTYQPRYWMINGRTFPDTIMPNYSSAMPAQPYGALVRVSPKCDTTTKPACSADPKDPTHQDWNPLSGVVRFLNAGPTNYPFHPHSNHDSEIGTDGRILVNPLANAGQGSNTSIDRFGFVMAPGQTAESMFNWVDAQQWDPVSNPINVPIPGVNNRTNGPYWNGTPYLGVKALLENGKTQWNQCGEYYHFAHSHALFQVTNYGTSGGGMLTLIRVDPPPSTQAKYGVNCNNGPGY